MKFIFYSGENNYYDDSDFYDVYFDDTTNEVVKHVWGSTRHAGSIEIKGETTNVINTPLYNEIMDKAKASVEMSVKKNWMDTIFFEIGDRVKNTNPRARKHKGLEFTVMAKSEWRSQYGRVESVNLIDSKGNRINQNNCTLIEIGEYRLNRIVGRILVGLSLRDM